MGKTLFGELNHCQCCDNRSQSTGYKRWVTFRPPWSVGTSLFRPDTSCVCLSKTDRTTCNISNAGSVPKDVARADNPLKWLVLSVFQIKERKRSPPELQFVLNIGDKLCQSFDDSRQNLLAESRVIRPKLLPRQALSGINLPLFRAFGPQANRGASNG